METETTQNTTTPEVVVSKKLSQKDAVFNFVIAALDAKPGPGEVLKSLVTKDLKKVVRTRLFEELKLGNIKLKRTMDDSKLKKYCSGLINHWLRRDPRFN